MNKKIVNTFFFILWIYVLIDSTTRYLLPIQKYFFVAIVLLLLLYLLIILLYHREIIFTLRLLIYMFMGLIFLFPILIREIIRYKYIFGDLVLFYFIPILYILLSRNDINNFYNKSKKTIKILFLAAIIAPFALSIHQFGDQYYPPSILLSAFMITSIFYDKKNRLLFIIILIVIFLLGYFSGQRTIVLINLVIFVIALFVFIKTRYAIIVNSILLFGCVFLFNYGLLNYSKFMEIDQIENSLSIQRRIFEVQDIASHINKNWTMLNYIFGEGHGAVFVPKYSYIGRTFDQGVIHNIHFGYIMIYFRYGVIGILFISYTLFVVFKDIFRVKIAIRNETFLNDLNVCWFIIFMFATLGVLMKLILFNIFHNPINGYIIVAYFYLKSNLKLHPQII